MITTLTAEMRLAEGYKWSKMDLIGRGVIPADSGTDYRARLATSRAVYDELAYLDRLDRRKDEMMLPRYSKRRARLVRLYWALKRMGR